MKAISLWQPWASLWLSPAKIHETRHWRTHHRGPLLVHAAKRFDKLDEDDALVDICWREFPNMNIPTGALLGIVNIVACVPTESFPPAHRADDDYVCGDFAEGRWAWRRSVTFVVFDAPIPYKGRQGLFDVPDDVIPAGILWKMP